MNRIVSLALFMFATMGCGTPRQYQVSDGRLYGVHVKLPNSLLCDELDYSKRDVRDNPNFSGGSAHEQVLCWRLGNIALVGADTDSATGNTRISEVRFSSLRGPLSFSSRDLEHHDELKRWGYKLLELGRAEFAAAQGAFDEQHK